MKLFRALFDLTTLPLEIVKDIVTLGGIASERRKSFTRERFEKLDNDFLNEPYEKDNGIFD